MIYAFDKTSRSISLKMIKEYLQLNKARTETARVQWINAPKGTRNIRESIAFSRNIEES